MIQFCSAVEVEMSSRIPESPEMEGAVSSANLVSVVHPFTLSSHLILLTNLLAPLHFYRFKDDNSQQHSSPPYFRRMISMIE